MTITDVSFLVSNDSQHKVPVALEEVVNFFFYKKRITLGVIYYHLRHQHGSKQKHKTIRGWQKHLTDHIKMMAFTTYWLKALVLTRGDYLYEDF